MSSGRFRGQRLARRALERARPAARHALDTARPVAARWWAEARRRAAEAWSFGGPPWSPPPADRRHRVMVLGALVGLTALLLATVSLPGVVAVSRGISGIAQRFSGPISQVALPKVAQRSVVLDRSGRVIATLAGEENRVLVDLKRVPGHARKAVLAIEDARFYSHHGVDPSGLVRALLANVRSGSVEQGGSTITQQLVKNTLVGSERSLDRKILEARMAVRLEKEMTKDEILEAYLNEAYFGNGVYGIGTASEFYFGRKVERLTIAQAALLAGIVKAPTNYEPLKNSKAARVRRDLVIRRMLQEGWITPKQARAAQRAGLGARAHPTPAARTPYFVEHVKQQILADPRFGETRADRARALFQAGLKITTTLDLRTQQRADDALAFLDDPDDPDAALVAIDPPTGQVRAVIGGRDFERTKFDVATQGHRQPGSTFKMVALVAALRAGFGPSLTFDAPSPLKLKDPGTGEQIQIENYSGKPEGFLDLRRATERSVNTYFIQLMQEVGPEKVAETGVDLGAAEELSAVLSLGLGTVAVTPMGLATAYATLANGGIRCKPYSILKVTGSDGRTIASGRPSCERTIEAPVVAQATAILRGVPERGTGRNARIGRPHAGKTGTTDRYTDAWYAGYTPQMAAVVWMGYQGSTRREMHKVHGVPDVAGGTIPAKMWATFMRAAHRGLPVRGFPAPPPGPAAKVPDLAGMSLEDARDALREARFFAVDASGTGDVTAQDPPPGATVPAGSLVTLTLGSARPTPSPEPSPSPTKKKPSPSSSPSPSPSSSPSASPTASPT